MKYTQIESIDGLVKTAWNESLPLSAKPDNMYSDEYNISNMITDTLQPAISDLKRALAKVEITPEIASAFDAVVSAYEAISSSVYSINDPEQKNNHYRTVEDVNEIEALRDSGKFNPQGQEHSPF